MGFTEMIKDFPLITSPVQPGADLDYSRWAQGGSRVVLHNVPWAPDYSDVIGFASAADRDSWFDGSTHDRFVIENASYIPFNATRCRVELSAARVACFNYVEIQTDAAPTQSDSFKGQVPPGPTRAYYFMRDFEQLAPDTCELKLTLDVWTTFIHSFSFGPCWLDRGHIGVEATTVDNYLSDPSSNTNWLLAPDVNFGAADMVSHVEQCDMWQGDCVCLVGLRADETWLESAPTLTVSGAQSISFYDVSGVRWGSEAGCTANAPVLVGAVNVPPASIGEDLQTTHYYVSQDPVALFANLEQSYSYVFNLLEAVYIVPSSFVVSGEAFQALGTTLAAVTTLPSSVQTISLSKEDFGFDTTVANFAKLYTYPYSALEYTTSDGISHEIKIEDTGSTLAFAARLAEVDNSLRLQTYLNDAAGFGSFDYEWHDTAKSLPKGVLQTLHVRGVPAFEMIVTKRASLAADRARDMEQKCREIETTYTNGARAENTVELNALDVNATNNTNALASNLTNRTNADTLADLAKRNADTSATTNKTVGDSTADLNHYTADKLYTAARDNADVALDSIENQSNTDKIIANAIHYIQSTQMSAEHTADADLQQAMGGITQDYVSQSSVSNTVATAVGGIGTVAGSAATGAAIGSAFPGLGTAAGAIAGSLIAATPTVVNIVSGGYNAHLTMTKDAAIVSASLTAMGDKYTAASDAFHDIHDQNLARADNIRIWTKYQLDEQATNNLNASVAINDETVRVNKANNNDIYSSQVNVINPDTNSTSKSVNAATQTTADANANRTKANSDAIAQYARDAAVLNLQDSARTSYAGLTAELASAGLAKHETVAGGANQEAYSFEREFDTVTIKTQSKDAILQAGKYFDLYGYAANRQYTPTPGGFSIADRNRSFWKFSDVKGTNSQGGNLVRDAIFNILRAGVTVWANPEVIYSA